MATAIELSNNEVQGLCQRYFREHYNTTDINNTKSNNNNNNKTTFEVLSYKLKPTSDSPAGFLGRHLFLNIELLIKEGPREEYIKNLRFFSKSASTSSDTHMEYLKDFGVFKKEIQVYQHVLPKIQESVGVEIAPKCYYADNNLLVFENLSDLNYRMGSKCDGLLDFEHLRCLVKTLASLHAGSIIYEIHTGKKLNELHSAAVVENAYPANVSPQHMRITNFYHSNVVLKEFIKTMPRYQIKLDYILENFTRHMSKIFDFVKPSSKYCNVFTHGDLWANNIMFQYDEFGNTPLQCRLVDFQLARYAPPALDLLTVLTIPTNQVFREKYLTELLNEYYRCLSEFLKRQNLNIADYLTEHEYYETVQQYRIAGLIESCLFCHLVALPSHLTQKLMSSADGFSDFFDSRRVEICLNAFKQDVIYRERLTDMLEDFIDNVVLKKV